MKKEVIFTDSVPKPIGPYSQAILYSSEGQKLLFSSGQIAINPQSGEVEGTISEQTKAVLTNIKNLLEASNSDINKVIKTTVYLKNMTDFARMNEIYNEFFGESKPARTTIEVSNLPKNALVEIEIIAYV